MTDRSNAPSTSSDDAVDASGRGFDGRRLDGRLPPPVDRPRRTLHAAWGRADLRWLVPALLGGALVFGVYLATNRFPASGAGLYLVIAEEIAANGYGLPTTIPSYTADGVPFAYPPLAFYVLAVALEFGVDPFVLTSVLPGVFTVAYLVPAYLLGRDLLGSRPRGTGTALLVAFNPQILQWHLTAGGVVRALAFLCLLSGIFFGVRLFAARDRRWLAPAIGAFGATVLTHPTYTLFFVVTYLLLWLRFDPTPAGLMRGTAVGLGGAAVASPWLLSVVATHGADVFLSAATTHGGVGGGLLTMLEEVSVASTIPLLAAAYMLVRREWFLPAWLVAAELLFKQPRFAYFVGALVLVAAATRFARRPIGAVGPRTRRRVVAAVIALALVVGTSAVAIEMTGVDDPSTPEYIDGDDVEAMQWVERETAADATFVVLGDAAEWFPYASERTILVSPWGVEWESAEEFERHIAAFEAASACSTADCVERATAEVGGDPDYLYVPKGGYTIRGERSVQFGTLERSLERTDRYVPVFENDGVVIYRATDG